MFNTFGNKVRIRSSLETDKRGLAGKIGEVYGQTTPSMMDIEVIGTPKEDYAVNVCFEDLRDSFWFDADLLEYLDNGQGTVITLDGIDKKWTKGTEGEWIEEQTTPTNTDKTKTQQTDKSWWKFWKK
jgi:hypothetical protein